MLKRFVSHAHTSHQSVGLTCRILLLTFYQKLEVRVIVLNFFLLGDNEAVIKMIVNGTSPHMRHVSRTHRVNLDRHFL